MTIEAEQFRAFLLDFASKCKQLRSRYDLDSDQPLQILEALEIIVNGLESLNEELLADFKEVLEILLTKLKRHYEGFDDSEKVGRVLDLYQKYFP